MSKRLRSSEMCADCSGPGECRRPGPLPSALLPGTPAPRRPHGQAAPGGRVLHPVCPGPRLGTAEAALGREPSRACQPGGQGAAALRSLPASRPRPSGEGRARGRLRLPQEGAWATRRKASYRSQRGRPPRRGPGAQVSPPGPPPAARFPPEPSRPEWATVAAPPRRDRPPTRGRLPAPGVRAPLPRGEAPGGRGLAPATGTQESTPVSSFGV